MNQPVDVAVTRARILADALAEVVDELRLIEPGDLIAYVRGGHWATIADLVESATELFFRAGALTFSCSAAFDVGWSSPPSISLDMEFQAGAVAAFFTLVLGAPDSVLDLNAVWFASPRDDEAAATAEFASAVAEARLLPLPAAGRAGLLPR